jgi:glycosyltransferase involved in cell wall biosynthesis
MTSNESNGSEPPYVSIAIFAWNEEEAVRSTLESLFEQTLFGQLRRRHLRSEVICVANGCTDKTAVVAGDFFRKVMLEHSDREALTAKLANLTARGKGNAWNQFVHQISDRGARFLFMMDADILIHRKETLWNMLNVLETELESNVAVDVPRKDIGFKQRLSIGERLSLAASSMTLAADGQLCGQLYCIRAQAARRIYLPKDLAACEDGLIKALVCTDFLSHDAWPSRIRVAPNAEHTFEAYTSLASILKNQKRQIMGQTIVHVLVDQYLRRLPAAERWDLAQFLRTKDVTDPSWLKRLIGDHLRRTRCFWRLHPGLLGNRLRHLSKLSAFHRVRCLPAALASAGASLAASLLAYGSLKNGCTDYWPKAKRGGFSPRSGLGMSSDESNTPISLRGIGGASEQKS